LIKRGDETPAVEFFRRLIDEFGKPLVHVRNFDILHIEPSGVPVPDGYIHARSEADTFCLGGA
jgi:hypothetical protein